MKRTMQIYNNYEKTNKNDKHILITGNLFDVIMDDFAEWLDDHNIGFLKNDIQKHIDDYITTLFYQLQDEGLDNEEIENVKNLIKRFLKNACEELPF